LSSQGSNIADIRRDYRLAELDESTAGDNPLAFFGKWFAEAEQARIDETNAMTLATVDADGKPHARIVLLKGLDEKGFVFFTNYKSAKGLELEANAFASIVFFWKELERQVRIEGIAEKLEAAESDHYFATRPAASRIGAWASPQSRIITGREELDENFKMYGDKFGEAVPRPPHWGGYRIIPHRIEFWQGRASRMHDRILFVYEDEAWRRFRLAP
jgi:pyridoxamine 5'-phosphate oxidase